MTRLTQEMLNQVERAVQGSCSSLQQNFDGVADYYNFGFEFDDLTTEEEMQLCDFIENLHFECTVCGWWCEVGDYSENSDDDNVCSQCGDD